MLIYSVYLILYRLKRKEPNQVEDAKEVSNNLNGRPILRRAFDLCDRDGNGTIDLYELADGLPNILPLLKLPINTLKSEDLGVLFAILDTDGNNVIDYSEFERGISNWRNMLLRVRRVQQIFPCCDPDDRGYV